MSTLKDIAEEAGVSIKTVSRILNGENKEAWPSSIRRAQKIRDIAQRMNFRPSATARTMRTNKTKMIGVLIRNASDFPFASPGNYEAILGMYCYLEGADYEMCLVHQTDMESRSRIFREHMLDGVIALGHLEKDWITEIRQAFTRCVWVDVNVNEPTMCVQRDEFSAGQLVGEAIAVHGYERVVWLGRSESEAVQHYSQPQRYAGLLDGLGSHLREHVQTRKIRRVDTASLDQLLHEVDRKTVIVPYDIMQANMILAGLTRNRMFPGDHVGLVCPDDSHQLTESSTDLCRVDFDRMHMGRIAAQMLVESLEGHIAKSICLNSHWVHGTTLVNHQQV